MPNLIKLITKNTPILNYMDYKRETSKLLKAVPEVKDFVISRDGSKIKIQWTSLENKTLAMHLYVRKEDEPKTNDSVKKKTRGKKKTSK